VNDLVPREIRDLISQAIPDLDKRLDYIRSMREFIKQLRAEGADAELDEWLRATIDELREESTRQKSEKRQARIHRIYGYLAPAAIPIVLGMLNGTIHIG